MMTDEYIEQLLTEYRARAKEFAQKKANSLFQQEFRKTIKSACMKLLEHQYPSVTAQEREAYNHAKYRTHLETMQQAVAEETLAFYALKEIEYEIELYRTRSANVRAERRGYGA